MVCNLLNHAPFFAKDSWIFYRISNLIKRIYKPGHCCIIIFSFHPLLSLILIYTNSISSTSIWNNFHFSIANYPSVLIFIYPLTAFLIRFVVIVIPSGSSAVPQWILLLKFPNAGWNFSHLDFLNLISHIFGNYQGVPLFIFCDQTLLCYRAIPIFDMCVITFEELGALHNHAFKLLGYTSKLSTI